MTSLAQHSLDVARDALAEGKYREAFAIFCELAGETFEYCGRAPAPPLNLTSFDAVMREQYRAEAVAELAWRDHPFLAGDRVGVSGRNATFTVTAVDVARGTITLESETLESAGSAPAAFAPGGMILPREARRLARLPPPKEPRADRRRSRSDRARPRRSRR